MGSSAIFFLICTKKNSNFGTKKKHEAISKLVTYMFLTLWYYSAYDTRYEKIAINNSVIDGKLRTQIR